MRLSLVTAPISEPVVPTEVINHLRLEPDTTEDDLLAALEVAARQHVENVTHRQLISATWKVTFDRFPRWRAPISLPLPPLQSVTSVKYLDAAGVEQTWASNQYVVDKPQGPRAMEGRIYPVLNVDYPTTCYREDSVTVEYVAGYGDAAAVPTALKQAILILVGGMYENRESTVPNALMENPAVQGLLGPYTRLSEAMR